MVAPGMGCDEQNGLPVSMGTMQRQPVWQGLVALHPPPQVAKSFASLRNCRAETVPAHRTPMTSAVKNIDLIVFMIAFLLAPGSKEIVGLLCRFGGNEIARAACESGLNDASAAQNVGTRVFLFVAEALAGGGLHIQGQLAGGNAPRTENAHDQSAEEYCLDLLVHGRFLSLFNYPTAGLPVWLQ
jgi:hypothetical protein